MAMKPFDNLIGCVRQLWKSHLTLQQQRFRDSGLTIDQFIEQERREEAQDAPVESGSKDVPRERSDLTRVASH